MIMSTSGAPSQPLMVKCPACGVSVAWGPQSPERPFCSPRCRDTDLIGWAKEEHRIEGDDEDLMSED
jgi:endogenous inhibitor of DNA gyrase (YacG/DUF329 family)